MPTIQHTRIIQHPFCLSHAGRPPEFLREDGPESVCGFRGLNVSTPNCSNATVPSWRRVTGRHEPFHYNLLRGIDSLGVPGCRTCASTRLRKSSPADAPLAGKEQVTQKSRRRRISGSFTFSIYFRANTITEFPSAEVMVSVSASSANTADFCNTASVPASCSPTGPSQNIIVAMT